MPLPQQGLAFEQTSEASVQDVGGYDCQIKTDYSASWDFWRYVKLYWFLYFGTVKDYVSLTATEKNGILLELVGFYGTDRITTQDQRRKLVGKWLPKLIRPYEHKAKVRYLYIDANKPEWWPNGIEFRNVTNASKDGKSKHQVEEVKTILQCMLKEMTTTLKQRYELLLPEEQNRFHHFTMLPAVKADIENTLSTGKFPHCESKKSKLSDQLSVQTEYSEPQSEQSHFAESASVASNYTDTCVDDANQGYNHGQPTDAIAQPSECTQPEQHSELASNPGQFPAINTTEMQLCVTGQDVETEFGGNYNSRQALDVQQQQSVSCSSQMELKCIQQTTCHSSYIEGFQQSNYQQNYRPPCYMVGSQAQKHQLLPSGQMSQTNLETPGLPIGDETQIMTLHTENLMTPRQAVDDATVTVPQQATTCIEPENGILKETSNNNLIGTQIVQCGISLEEVDYQQLNAETSQSQLLQKNHNTDANIPRILAAKQSSDQAEITNTSISPDEEGQVIAVMNAKQGDYSSLLEHVNLRRQPSNDMTPTELFDQASMNKLTAIIVQNPDDDVFKAVSMEVDLPPQSQVQGMISSESIDGKTFDDRYQPVTSPSLQYQSGPFGLSCSFGTKEILMEVEPYDQAPYFNGPLNQQQPCNNPTLNGLTCGVRRASLIYDFEERPSTSDFDVSDNNKVENGQEIYDALGNFDNDFPWPLEMTAKKKCITSAIEPDLCVLIGQPDFTNLLDSMETELY